MTPRLGRRRRGARVGDVRGGEEGEAGLLEVREDAGEGGGQRERGARGLLRLMLLRWWWWWEEGHGGEEEGGVERERREVRAEGRQAER